MEKGPDEGYGGGYAGQPFKHIILGIDGTWQAAYSDIFHSNVFRLNLALNYRDNSPNKNFQIFIYSSGLGTTNASSRLAAGALGDGLDESVLQAYINLVSNYAPGDKIYIFGFSRGAVAARALSGFITYSGVLKADHAALIEHAWRYYTGAEPLMDYASQRNLVTHENVEIEFLGVWDTVTGPYKQNVLMRRYRFNNLKLDRSVKCGIHILSMDESRSDFEPLLWNGRSHDRQVLEQIWMPGVHGDIGGGYHHAFLSTVSLLLMIDKLAQYHPELGLDDRYINGLLEILQAQDVVVNDEWATYKARILRWFTTVSRFAHDDPECRYFLHPIVGMMHQKRIRFKRRRSPYQSSLRVHRNSQLEEAMFEAQSWYLRRIAEILRSRLP